MSLFTDFFKNILSGGSKNDVPDLYTDLPVVVKDAVIKELEIYNFSKDKKLIIGLKVEASLNATLKYDTAFRERLESASSQEEVRQVIRGYLRSYIRGEIDKEIANAKSEIRNNILSSDIKSGGNLISFFDPRFKGKVTPGDYSQYDAYRKNVTQFIFPETSKLNSEEKQKETGSEFLLRIKKEVEEFNKKKLAPSGNTNNAIKARKLLEIDKNRKLKSDFNKLTQDIKVYDPSAGRFLGFTELSILSKIELNLGKYIKTNITSKQKIELMDHINSGNVAQASKFLIIPKNSGKTFEEIITQVSSVVPTIKINENGEAELSDLGSEGGDSINRYFDNGIDQFGKKLKKNQTEAVIDVQQNYFVSNILTIKTLIENEKTSPSEAPVAGVKTTTEQLTQLLQQNQFASDLISFSRSIKNINNLSVADQKIVSSLKTGLLKAVADNVISFKSEADKQRFVEALEKGDSKYLKKFVTPGLLGNSTFGSFLKELNKNSLEAAGRVGSKQLASRALNLANSLTIYKQEVLSSFIYASQLGFDQGYLVSEIKKKILEDERVKLLIKMDSQVTWDSVKTLVKNKFLDLVTKSIVDKSLKDNTRNDLEFVLGYITGKNTFKDLAVRQLKYRFEIFTKLSGDKLSKLLKPGLKDLSKTQFIRRLQLRLVKYSRYLKQASQILINKFAPGLGSTASRLIAVGWSYASRNLGKFITSVTTFLGNSFKGGFDAEAFERAAKGIALGCLGFVLIFLILILAPMMVILGGLNSFSSSRFESALFTDVTYGGPVSAVDQLNFFGPGSFASGNACLKPTGEGAYVADANPSWNNLKISDFDGLTNDKNCRIMCKAKEAMGKMFPGPGGNIYCNAESTFNVNDIDYQYVCTDLIRNAYCEDDKYGKAPDARNICNLRLVIDQDDYLKANSGSNGKYIQTDLALPSPNTNLTLYQPYCIPLDKITTGSIIIFRGNTCNDKRESGGYRTILRGGTPVVTNGAHVELVLKVVDKGSQKIVETISTNSTVKKVTYPLDDCGGGNYSFRVKKDGAIINGTDGDAYPCRLYELREVNTGLSCPKVVINGVEKDGCNLGENNYLDRDSYPSVSN